MQKIKRDGAAVLITYQTHVRVHIRKVQGSSITSLYEKAARDDIEIKARWMNSSVIKIIAKKGIKQ